VPGLTLEDIPINLNQVVMYNQLKKESIDLAEFIANELHRRLDNKTVSKDTFHEFRSVIDEAIKDYADECVYENNVAADDRYDY
jgi:hypothetical protein